MQIDIFNTTNTYDVILCDAPWNFKTYSDKGKDRSPDQHYVTQDLNWIKSLPIKKLANPRCALFMWAIDPMIPEALDCIKSYGFKYVTVGFYCGKLNKTAKREAINADKDLFLGLGYYARANPEVCFSAANCEDDEMQMCLLSRLPKGAPKRQSASVRKLQLEHRREHSRKPAIIHDKIDELFGKDSKKLEIFGREERVGWDVFGNEVEKFNAK